MTRFALAIALTSIALTAQTEGTLTVAGKTHPLNFAYASLQPSDERSGKKELLLIVSDSKMPAAIERNSKAQDELAQSGKIHFVRPTFTYPDPARPSPCIMQ